MYPNTSRNVGALKIAQCTAVVSSALLANGQGVGVTVRVRVRVNMHEGFNLLKHLQKPVNIKASVLLIIHIWSNPLPKLYNPLLKFVAILF